MPNNENHIILVVKGNDSGSNLKGPLTTGFSLPENAVKDIANLCLNNNKGYVTAQFRPLSFWPDGSIQWILIDFEGRIGDRVMGPLGRLAACFPSSRLSMWSGCLGPTMIQMEQQVRP